ncbi:histidine phosphatase family protein, partial [Mesorhizobium sp. M2A.F.Ca.ET.040.01.1.1]
AVLGNDDPGDTAFVGHGGVGTLLLLSLTGRAISREADQPAGGGNYFAYDIGAHSLIHGWRPIDRASPRLDD